MNKLSARFLDIFNSDAFPYDVLVIGAGSVGSNIILHLAKMGIKNIGVCDFDTISEENIGVSILYGFKDIGKNKAMAIKEKVLDLVDDAVRIHEFTDRIENNKEIINDFDIVISAVDSISARQNIFNIVLESKNVKLYIDTAMGGMALTAKVVDMSDENDKYKYYRYITSLNDSNVPDIRCTSKSTLHGTSVLAAFVESIIIQYYNSQGKKPMFSTKDFNFNLAVFSDL
ncbi:MAG: ThiF family adenylyltransferase [candidate division WOR-3 bacterium]